MLYIPTCTRIYPELKQINRKKNSNPVENGQRTSISNIKKYQNINKYLMSCLGSLVIREIKIKTKIRHYLTFITLLNIKGLDPAKDWQEYDDLRMQLF